MKTFFRVAGFLLAAGFLAVLFTAAYAAVLTESARASEPPVQVTCEQVTLTVNRPLVNGDHLNIEVTQDGRTFQVNGYVDRNIQGGWDTLGVRFSGPGGQVAVPLTQEQVQSGVLVHPVKEYLGDTYQINWVQGNSNYFNQDRSLPPVKCEPVVVPPEPEPSTPVEPEPEPEPEVPGEPEPSTPPVTEDPEPEPTSPPVLVSPEPETPVTPVTEEHTVPAVPAPAPVTTETVSPVVQDPGQSELDARGPDDPAWEPEPELAKTGASTWVYLALGLGMVLAGATLTTIKKGR